MTAKKTTDSREAPPELPGAPDLPEMNDKPDLMAISVGGFGMFKLGDNGIRGLGYMIDPNDGLHMEIIVQYGGGKMRRFVAPVTMVVREFKDKVIATPKTGADALVVPG
jgi:hypothetical protein